MVVDMEADCVWRQNVGQPFHEFVESCDYLVYDANFCGERSPDFSAPFCVFRP
jgi:hypothetical protein